LKDSLTFPLAAIPHSIQPAHPPNLATISLYHHQFDIKQNGVPPAVINTLREETANKTNKITVMGDDGKLIYRLVPSATAPPTSSATATAPEQAPPSAMTTARERDHRSSRESAKKTPRSGPKNGQLPMSAGWYICCSTDALLQSPPPRQTQLSSHPPLTTIKKTQTHDSQL
jgi:hypothetical protein